MTSSGTATYAASALDSLSFTPAMEHQRLLNPKKRLLREWTTGEPAAMKQV